MSAGQRLLSLVCLQLAPLGEEAVVLVLAAVVLALAAVGSLHCCIPLIVCPPRLGGVANQPAALGGIIS